MSKTIKNSFDKKLTFENLLKAHDRARMGKNMRRELLKFEIDLENNMINIFNSLKNGSYKLGNYRVFKVYEPKERVIKCLPYRDRIVQQWYVYEFIMPYIVPRFINTNCACIEGKGTHYAVNITQRYMRAMKRRYGSYFILKLDIKKYFYNIDREILFNIMKKYISDKKLLWLTGLFIYDNDDRVNIPIGNYTSQYFANIYLNELDYYIKGVLGIKYYVRYMDDMVLLFKSKEECVLVMDKIRSFLRDKLKLELNDKSRYYPSSLGVNFCGYRIYETHRLVRNSSKKMIRKKVKLWKKLYRDGKLDTLKMKLSFNSWLNHVGHANSYNLRKRVEFKFKGIKD